MVLSRPVIVIPDDCTIIPRTQLESNRWLIMNAEFGCPTHVVISHFELIGGSPTHQIACEDEMRGLYRSVLPEKLGHSTQGRIEMTYKSIKKRKLLPLILDDRASITLVVAHFPEMKIRYLNDRKLGH
jgi:hypothetical protein